MFIWGAGDVSAPQFCAAASRALNSWRTLPHDSPAMKAFFHKSGPALLSGLLLALAFPAWGAYPLAWVALVPLFSRVHGLNPRQAFAHFFLAGLMFYLLLLQWLLANVYWAGGWAVIGYTALSAALALYWGVLGLVYKWSAGRFPWIPGPLLLALLWAAMEVWQARLFTGFGWGAIGYSQGPDLPLVQWAAAGGVSLVSGIVVAANVLFAQAWRGSRRVSYAAGGIALVLAAHGIGWAMLGEPDYGDDPYVAGMVQADFPLEMKWDSEYTVEMVRNAAHKSRLLADREPVDLFVWPESLIMTDIRTPQIEDLVTSLCRDTGAVLFAGSHRTNPVTGGPLNSSFLVDSQGEIGEHYDKMHLAPFGEYMPFSKHFPFLKKLVPAIGAVEPGGTTKVIPTNGKKLGPLICFEVLFSPLSEELRRQRADFLVVITNLGWFGHSNAIPQEFEIARLRAVETRLALVHTANTGISGVFDPWGRFAGVQYYAEGDRLYEMDHLRPAQTIMARFVGAAPVARPAARPVAFGPALFAKGMMALSVALVLLSALMRPSAGLQQPFAQTQAPSAKRPKPEAK